MGQIVIGKLTVAQLIEELPVFDGNRRIITVIATDGQMNQGHALTFYIINVSNTNFS
jgi:hypothetical protein